MLKTGLLSCAESENFIGIEENGHGTIVGELDGHVRLKNACLDADTQRRYGTNEFFIKNLSLFRRRCLNKTGPTATARVTIQSELGYRKDCTTNIEKRAVHLSLIIVKNAQVHDFFSNHRGSFGRVRASNADENDKAHADFPGHASIHHNAGPAHALDHRSHDDAPFLRMEFSGG